MSAEADPDTDRHKLEKKLLTFTNELQPKIRPVLIHVCKEFVEEAEGELLSHMQADQIGDELES